MSEARRLEDLRRRKADRDARPLRQEAIVKALQVIVLDRVHRAWMKENDPQALLQAVNALKDAGYEHTPKPLGKED